MKHFKGIGSPLLVVLLLDFLMLLAVPALLIIERSACTAKAVWGVVLPELDYEGVDAASWCETPVVRVVMGSDGSVRIRGKMLAGEALVSELFTWADMRLDENGDSRVGLILIAHRDVAYRHVAALMRTVRAPPLKMVSGEVRFVGKGTGGLEDHIDLLMTEAAGCPRLTVSAPPWSRWEDVLAAVVAKIPIDEHYIDLLLAEEESTSGTIEVSVKLRRND